MEVWKDIVGFEGVYQISNQGKVKSLARTQTDSKGRTVHYKEKLLKLLPNSHGYLRVVLKSNGEIERWFVHRLVATHFVENPHPELYTVVNHRDSNFMNNCEENLEWTTVRGNMRHAYQNGRMNRTSDWLKHLRETNEKNGSAVIGTNEKTGEMICFVCLNDCEKAGFQPSCVCNCCKGIRQTHKGFRWRYATPDEKANMLSLWKAGE